MEHECVKKLETLKILSIHERELEDEIYNIAATDVPTRARANTLQRRAAALPYRCPRCNRMGPHLYPCAACGLLMTGTALFGHETNCNDNRIQ